MCYIIVRLKSKAYFYRNKGKENDDDVDDDDNNNSSVDDCLQNRYPACALNTLDGLEYVSW